MRFPLTVHNTAVVEKPDITVDASGSWTLDVPPVHFNTRCVSRANSDALRNTSSYTSSDTLTDEILLYHPTIDLSRVTPNGHVIAVLVCGLQIRLTLVFKLRHVVEFAVAQGFQVSVYMEVVETGYENGASFRKLSHLDRNTSAEEENLERVLVRKISDAGGRLEFLKLKKDNVDAIFNEDDYSDDWLAETAKTRLQNFKAAQERREDLTLSQMHGVVYAFVVRWLVGDTKTFQEMHQDTATSEHLFDDWNQAEGFARGTARSFERSSSHFSCFSDWHQDATWNPLRERFSFADVSIVSDGTKSNTCFKGSNCPMGGVGISTHYPPPIGTICCPFVSVSLNSCLLSFQSCRAHRITYPTFDSTCWLKALKNTCQKSTIIGHGSGAR